MEEIRDIIKSDLEIKVTDFFDKYLDELKRIFDVCGEKDSHTDCQEKTVQDLKVGDYVNGYEQYGKKAYIRGTIYKIEYDKDGTI